VVFNSEIFTLLKVQLGKPAKTTSETLIIQLISLLQKTVWDQAYHMNDAGVVVNINGVVKDLLSILEDAKELGLTKLCQTIGGFSLSYCLREKNAQTYQQIFGNLYSTNHTNDAFLALLSVSSALNQVVTSLEVADLGIFIARHLTSLLEE
jgi:hypothetical protein